MSCRRIAALAVALAVLAGRGAHAQDAQEGPPGDCAAAATFSSLACRVEALTARVEAESALGDLQAKLARALNKAGTRTQQADEVCGQSDVRHAKVRLRELGRTMIQYGHRLGGLRSRRRLPNALRQELIARGNDIRTDGQTLRAVLACPDDAGR